MGTKLYTVLGAGRQGKAAAYDLAKFGNAKAILLADEDPATAKQATAELNHLLEKNIVHPIGVNARSTDAVYNLLMESIGFVSAVHYNLNIALTELAVETGCHMVDLGGNTNVVWRQHQLHEEARKVGVRIIPDCGMAPGLANTLISAALQRVALPSSAQAYCGGIPQMPRPPLGYHFPLAVSGLINECSGYADIVRGGEVVQQSTLFSIEEITVPGIGTLEATHTSGGLSTAPWTLIEQYPSLKTLEHKTLRYPGHWEILQNLARKGKLASGLEAFAKATPPDLEDLGILSVYASGHTAEGKLETLILEIIDRYDPYTHLTAMQRLTGFHASIMLIAATEIMTETGVLKVEAIDPQMVISEFAKRGIVVEETRATSFS
ncbi:MAG: hypothetical protein A3D65_02860 [Candidatus Lloydbacteria bacterium RIFCSPHIGHO2_02_FULL_50_13]|uniref:Saccharopine dehydrogenase n=1 Tax=Candidatus Lloydbacteria bacterium RIFCSPHIGHO2_02_FULL_50_13 TaxID=1798661 RepID=A0A1G2D2J4_9BACT|nr:MAG: hypothetical protein A3D65_02860 [Candidatus Lloydbacteria bacterium RIFCSPHIGHO2_02_FULL_50_13]